MAEASRNPEAEVAAVLIGKILAFLDKEVGDLSRLAELRAIISVLVLRAADDSLEFLLQEVGTAWAMIREEEGSIVEVHLVSSTKLVPSERKN